MNYLYELIINNKVKIEDIENKLTEEELTIILLRALEIDNNDFVNNIMSKYYSKIKYSYKNYYIIELIIKKNIFNSLVNLLTNKSHIKNILLYLKNNNYKNEFIILYKKNVNILTEDTLLEALIYFELYDEIEEYIKNNSIPNINKVIIYENYNIMKKYYKKVDGIDINILKLINCKNIDFISIILSCYNFNLDILINGLLICYMHKKYILFGLLSNKLYCEIDIRDDNEIIVDRRIIKIIKIKDKCNNCDNVIKENRLFEINDKKYCIICLMKFMLETLS